MKALVSGLIALAILSGAVAAPAAALDSRKFWDEQHDTKP
jgi:hypothetical protein